MARTKGAKDKQPRKRKTREEMALGARKVNWGDKSAEELLESKGLPTLNKASAQDKHIPKMNWQKTARQKDAIDLISSRWFSNSSFI